MCVCERERERERGGEGSREGNDTRSNYTKMIQLLDGEKRRKEVSKIFTDEKMFRDACHKTFLSCLSIQCDHIRLFLIGLDD